MTKLLNTALTSLTHSVNLSTGITHSNDKNRAKETFKRLHDHGEILLKGEITAWATANGWKPDDADELGSLAQQIGDGKNVVITNGPWWNENIIEIWSRPDERPPAGED